MSLTKSDDSPGSGSASGSSAVHRSGSGASDTGAASLGSVSAAGGSTDSNPGSSGSGSASPRARRAALMRRPPQFRLVALLLGVGLWQSLADASFAPWL